MAHEDDSPPPEYDGATKQMSWSARNSLRKSLNIDAPIVDGEASPLLGSSSTDDDDEQDHERRDEEEPVWEGMADFESLPWWRRPSVSTTDLLEIRSFSPNVDILAGTYILLIRPRIRGNHSSQNQPYTSIDMLGILYGVIKERSFYESTFTIRRRRWR
jgi:hypothetical protein